MADRFHSKPAEIKQLLAETPDAVRARELHDSRVGRPRRSEFHRNFRRFASWGIWCAQSRLAQSTK